jgi:ketosteroid isomerase-like protein
MDHLYAISAAKTEYREGYNTGDIERVLAVFADAFIDMSEGQVSVFGPEAKRLLRIRLADLFAHYEVTIGMMIVDIQVAADGQSALDFGWHKFWLAPRSGGAKLYFKLKYFERWALIDGRWKITYLISSKEEEPRMEPRPESEVVAELAGITVKPARSAF